MPKNKKRHIKVTLNIKYYSSQNITKITV
uniref:Uncharacterized protein n=1 Tax=Arundo donax TaxID=35708 RepID=A0A0A8XTP0_ARUDO